MKDEEGNIYINLKLTSGPKGIILEEGKLGHGYVRIDLLVIFMTIKRRELKLIPQGKKHRGKKAQTLIYKHMLDQYPDMKEITSEMFALKALEDGFREILKEKYSKEYIPVADKSYLAQRNSRHTAPTSLKS